MGYSITLVNIHASTLHNFASALSVLNAAARVARSTIDKENVQFRIRQTEQYQAAVASQQKQDVAMVSQGTVVTQGTISRRMGGDNLVSIREASTTPKYPTEPPTWDKTYCARYRSQRAMLLSIGDDAQRCRGGEDDFALQQQLS